MGTVSCNLSQIVSCEFLSTNLRANERKYTSNEIRDRYLVPFQVVDTFLKCVTNEAHNVSLGHNLNTIGLIQ